MQKYKCLFAIPAISALLTGCTTAVAPAVTKDTFVMSKDLATMALPDEGKQIWEDASLNTDESLHPIVYVGHRDTESAQKYYILAEHKGDKNNGLTMVEVSKDVSGALGSITYISYTLADGTLPNNSAVQKLYDSTEAAQDGVTLNDQYDTSVTVDDSTKQLLDKAMSDQEGLYTPIEVLAETKAGSRMILCYESSSPHANGAKHFCFITIDKDGELQNKKCIDPDDFDAEVTGEQASVAFASPSADAAETTEPVETSN